MCSRLQLRLMAPMVLVLVLLAEAAETEVVAQANNEDNSDENVDDDGAKSSAEVEATADGEEDVDGVEGKESESSNGKPDIASLQESLRVGGVEGLNKMLKSIQAKTSLLSDASLHIKKDASGQEMYDFRDVDVGKHAQGGAARPEPQSPPLQRAVATPATMAAPTDATPRKALVLATPATGQVEPAVQKSQGPGDPVATFPAADLAFHQAAGSNPVPAQTESTDTDQAGSDEDEPDATLAEDSTAPGPVMAAASAVPAQHHALVGKQAEKLIIWPPPPVATVQGQSNTGLTQAQGVDDESVTADSPGGSLSDSPGADGPRSNVVELEPTMQGVASSNQTLQAKSAPAAATVAAAAVGEKADVLLKGLLSLRQSADALIRSVSPGAAAMASEIPSVPARGSSSQAIAAATELEQKMLGRLDSLEKANLEMQQELKGQSRKLLQVEASQSREESELVAAKQERDKLRQQLDAQLLRGAAASPHAVTARRHGRHHKPT